MLKNLLSIIISLSCLFSLPIEVKWSKTKEHDVLCRSIYLNAITGLDLFLSNNNVESISYKEFYGKLKKGEDTFTKSIECTKKECLGLYQDDTAFYFEMKLNQFFISAIKRNGIKYTFNSNSSHIKDKIKFIENNRNYAIVMDLDETVLDNSQYQVQLFKKNESFNQVSWSDWVNRGVATLIPGAKEFIDYARSQNIQIIFMSNRMNYNLEPTIQNLKSLDVFQDNDIFLLRKDKGDKKTVRRAEIYSGSNRMSSYPKFNVIAYFGDQRGDFPKIEDADSWPQNYYMFPNPMYGKWARN